MGKTTIDEVVKCLHDLLGEYRERMELYEDDQDFMFSCQPAVCNAKILLEKLGHPYRDQQDEPENKHMLTREHIDFINWLTKRSPLLAAVMDQRWRAGEKYYLDDRENIGAQRRKQFDKLNQQMPKEMP